MIHATLGGPVILLIALAQESPRLERPLVLQGLIKPSVEIGLSCAVDGLIEEVVVDRGDVVTKGQVLVRLESSVESATERIARARTEMVAELESAKQSFEFSSREYDHDRPLFERGLISAEAMDKSETDKRLAEAAYLKVQEDMRLAQLELERAKAALDLRTIRSPISGVVVERYLTPGELVSRSEVSKILELARLDPLHVEVIVPVSGFGKVAVGAEAEIRPQDPVGGLYSARVTIVDRLIDPVSGTFGVRLELDNPGYRLPSGLKCQVTILPGG